MRVVVLVGAGASFGAFDNPDLKPPLGDFLYPRLVAEYSETWGHFPEDVAAVFDADGFELGMAALREEAIHTQAALIDMGSFFATFCLRSGVNRYLALAKALEFCGPSIEYTFGSLNYETYLEQTFWRMGWGVHYWGMPHPDNHGRHVRIIKPHGSCNFIVDTGTNRFEGTRIIGGGVYIGGTGLKVVDLDDVVGAAITGFPSAMSLYAPGKPDLVCPEFVQGLRAGWTAAIDGADAIAIIGARPMFESDPHVWGTPRVSVGQLA